MKAIAKVGIAATIFIGGMMLLANASKYSGLTDKIKFNPGVPRIHNADFNFVTIVLDQMEITNQSALSTGIQNLYVTVQYLKNGVWTDLMYQKTPVANVTLQPYATQRLPALTLSMPTTSGTILPSLINSSDSLKVVTRFTYKGVEIPQETMVSVKEYLNPVISFIKNPASLFNINIG